MSIVLQSETKEAAVLPSAAKPPETAFDREIDRRCTASVKWDKYQGRDVLPFWIADMDFAAPDFILDAISRRLAHGILGYTHTPEALDAAFQGWLERRHGWTVPREWLVWVPGVVPGLNLAALAAGEPGASLLLPTPIYFPFLSVAANAGQRSIEAPMRKAGGRWEMDFDALEAAVRPDTRLLLIANPQNPTGRVYEEAELAALADFAARHDLWICSDEIHCDLVLDRSARHRPIASLGPEVAARTISLYAATKTFNVPGLSCAVAVIPDAAMRTRFQAARGGLVPDIGPLAYAAAEAGFSHAGGWQDSLLAYLRGNHRRLQEAVGERMTPVQATYMAWIDLRDLGLANPAAQFERCGLGLSDGAQFAGPGFLRFNFGCPRSLLERGIERYHRALQTLGADALVCEGAQLG